MSSKPSASGVNDIDGGVDGGIGIGVGGIGGERGGSGIIGGGDITGTVVFC